MSVADVNAVVRVHMQAFPGFFLTFLGPGFLMQMYRGIASDPVGIAFVAERGGTCCGFVAGTAEPAGFYSRLLQRRFFQFGFHAALAVLRRPRVAPRLLRAFTRPKEAQEGGAGRAELMSLAVLPSSRGSGMGSRLIDAFMQRAEASGVHAVFLSTDAVDNDAVNALYVRHGFAVCRTFTTPEGRQMNEYLRDVERNRGEE